MRAQGLKFLSHLVLVGLSLAVIACGKKCQQPVTTPYTSITGTDWRLIASTDPSVSSNLSNFTFLIWHFDLNFTGNIKKVVNNEQYDTPVYTLNYNVDPTSNILRVQFQVPPAQTQQGQTTAQPTDGGTFDYSYSLSNTLTLTDTTQGYSYNFVPFQGIVSPDTSCTF